MKTSSTLVKIAVAIQLFIPNSHASFVNVDEQAEELVDRPLYDNLGDTSNPTSLEWIKKQQEKIKNRPTAVCNEKSKPFQKKEDAYIDSNNTPFVVPHTGFPLASAVPVVEDQLATVSFFRDKFDEKFYVSKWSNESFPITFTLTAESKRYYSKIKTLIDKINLQLQNKGVIPSSKKVIALSSSFIPVSQNNCNTHIIHIDKTAMGDALTDGDRIFDDENRLGQFYDADILLPSPETMDLTPEHYKYAKLHNLIFMNQYLENMFTQVFTHEMMHALGVGHNFALGTLMDYTPQGFMYPEMKTSNEDSEFSRIFDRSLAYETEVLKFLYLPNYRKSVTVWPLVRSTNPATNSNLDKIKVWKAKKTYVAAIDPGSSRYICASSTATTDLTSTLGQYFAIDIDFEPLEGFDLQYYTGIGNVKIDLKDVLPHVTFSFEDVHRIFPVIKLKTSTSMEATFRNSLDAIYNENIRLVLSPQFAPAYSQDSHNEIHLKFRNGESVCELKLGFTLDEYR